MREGGCGGEGDGGVGDEEGGCERKVVAGQGMRRERARGRWLARKGGRKEEVRGSAVSSTALVDFCDTFSLIFLGAVPSGGSREGGGSAQLAPHGLHAQPSTAF